MTYIPQTFINGAVLSAADLNNLAAGVEEALRAKTEGDTFLRRFLPEDRTTAALIRRRYVPDTPVTVDRPVRRGGENLLDPTAGAAVNGVTFTALSDGALAIGGTATEDTRFTLMNADLPAATYYLTSDAPLPQGVALRVLTSDGELTPDGFTLTAPAAVRCVLEVSRGVVPETTLRLMLSAGERRPYEKAVTERFDGGDLPAVAGVNVILAAEPVTAVGLLTVEGALSRD